MITRRMRIQLIAFCILTLVMTSFVGAKYARVDRLLGAGGYAVTVKMLNGGGIFTGADVTYRGVSIGRVQGMYLTSEGVDVKVHVDRDTAAIPRDTEVVVANKSAVGEQFLDFQPATRGGPYLEDGSVVPADRTKIPIDTRTLLTDVTGLLSSVNPADLTTVIRELGDAFQGAGPDLRTTMRSTESFVSTADDEYAITAALIKQSTQVLKTQVDASDDITDFATNLRVLSSALAGSDTDLRTVIDNGAATAVTLRQVIAENAADVARMLKEAITLNKVVRAHLGGLRGVLVIAPAGVESAFSIIARDAQTGQYSMRVSLSLQPDDPPCTKGYVPSAKQRTPFDRTPAAWNAGVGCTAKTPRGITKGSGAGARTTGASAPAAGAGDATLGTYDVRTNTLAVSDTAQTIPDAPALGKESWKWMVLGPAVAR